MPGLHAELNMAAIPGTKPVISACVRVVAIILVPSKLGHSNGELLCFASNDTPKLACKVCLDDRYCQIRIKAKAVAQRLPCIYRALPFWTSNWCHSAGSGVQLQVKLVACRSNGCCCRVAECLVKVGNNSLARAFESWSKDLWLTSSL